MSHALADELRRIGAQALTVADKKYLLNAAIELESSYERRHDWSNADILRMADDLDKQAKKLADWHDPTGHRAAAMYRGSANLRLAYAATITLPLDCGADAPSGKCRRERGHTPPWGHQGDSPDPYPLEDPAAFEHVKMIPNFHPPLDPKRSPAPDHQQLVAELRALQGLLPLEGSYEAKAKIRDIIKRVVPS